MPWLCCWGGARGAQRQQRRAQRREQRRAQRHEQRLARQSQSAMFRASNTPLAVSVRPREQTPTTLSASQGPRRRSNIVDPEAVDTHLLGTMPATAAALRRQNEQRQLNSIQQLFAGHMATAPSTELPTLGQSLPDSTDQPQAAPMLPRTRSAHHSRFSSRESSGRTSPIGTPTEPRDSFHSMDRDGIGIRVSRQSDGSLTLQLESASHVGLLPPSHDASDRLRQVQREHSRRLDLSHEQASAISDLTNPDPTPAGSPPRRVEDLIATSHPTSLAEILLEVQEMLAMAYLDQKERVGAEDELNRIRADREVVEAHLDVLALEQEYDLLNSHLSQSEGDMLRTAGKRERDELELKLIHRRCITIIAETAAALALLERQPEHEEAAEAQRLRIRKQMTVLERLSVGQSSTIRDLRQAERDSSHERRKSVRYTEEQEGRKATLEQRIQDLHDAEACQSFRAQQLHARKTGKLELVLQREGLMRDSWLAMTALPVHQLQRRLFVSFEGEAGRDFGGLAREWMDLMCNGAVRQAVQHKALLDVTGHAQHLMLSPTMTPTKEALDTIEFLGRVVGLALFHGRLINPHFSLIVYKMLLDQPCASLDDLATVDPEMHHGLMSLLKMSDVESLDMVFEVTDPDGKTHPLIEGGSTKPVTDANKRDYVDCLLQWRLNRGVAELLEAFKIGLTSFIPLSALAGFTAPRLRLLVSGLQQIDVREWRTATAYVNGYGEDAIQVQWFWQWVDQADEAQRAKLLTFCTGSTQLPAQGFHGLSGIHGYCPFVIARVGDVDRYPAAHTCVNRLDLPAYASRDVLHARLSFAVQETEGFGLV